MLFLGSLWAETHRGMFSDILRLKSRCIGILVVVEDVDFDSEGTNGKLLNDA